MQTGCLQVIEEVELMAEMSLKISQSTVEVMSRLRDNFNKILEKKI